jgi:hypothetical protein
MVQHGTSDKTERRIIETPRIWIEVKYFYVKQQKGLLKTGPIYFFGGLLLINIFLPVIDTESNINKQHVHKGQQELQLKSSLSRVV